MTTKNQNKALAIANCLYSFKLKDAIIGKLEGGGTELLKQCQVAVEAVGKHYSKSEAYNGISVLQFDNIINVIKIRALSNRVIDARDEIANFILRAKEIGFLPPENPLTELVRFNSKRSTKNATGKKGVLVISPSVIDAAVADSIISELDNLVKLVSREKQGNSVLGTKPVNNKSAQISSYSFLLNGYDLPTNDGQNDLQNFLPDVNKIVSSKIAESINTLDFKNRIPKILFVLKYEVNGIFRGAIVGWKIIHDASSYTLKRRDVFLNKVKEFEYSNESLVAEYNSVKQYVLDWVLSFYNQYDEDMIWAVLDGSAEKDRQYSYTLVAHQNLRTDKNFIFNVDVSKLTISRLQLNDIVSEIKDYVATTVAQRVKGVTENDISPYPFLSKKFYGHDKFDWIIAAMNVKAAMARGDSQSEIKNYSYVGANIEFLNSKIIDNTMLIPNNIDQVLENVKESIITYGLSQTLIEIIEFTGLNFFFGGKETINISAASSNMFSGLDLGPMEEVLSAIDPETATVDVESLISNLLVATKGSNQSSSAAASPSEIDVPQQLDDSTQANESFDLITKFDLSKEALDLATFEGISDFVRLIRLFFDFSPNRTMFGAGTQSNSSSSAAEPQKLNPLSMDTSGVDQAIKDIAAAIKSGLPK